MRESIVHTYAPTRKEIDDGVFTVSNIFTKNECAQLIKRAEAIGFEAASVRTLGGPQMMPKVRNNDRVSLTDPATALEMWNRIEPFLPELDGSKPCSIDPNLRFYRYFPGQQFKRHKDGSTTNEAGQKTKLSYLIYLNDDCEGGSTNFSDFRDVNGVRQLVEFIVTPTVGSALLFRHEHWHEGTVVTAGVKYLFRSDVFYSNPEI